MRISLQQSRTQRIPSGGWISRRGPAAWRLALGTLLLGAGAGLVYLHARVLLERILSDTLLHPVVLTQWGGSLLLLALLFASPPPRIPLSLIWGRKALAFWLLVLMLHVGLPAPVQEAAFLSGESSRWSWRELLLVLPITAALALALRRVLRVLARPFTDTDSRPPLWRHRRDETDRVLPLQAVCLRPLIPRAPPA